MLLCCVTLSLALPSSRGAYARKLLQASHLVCYAPATENYCVLVFSNVDVATCDSQADKLPVLTDNLEHCYVPLPVTCGSGLAQALGQEIEECGVAQQEYVQKYSVDFVQQSGEPARGR